MSEPTDTGLPLTPEERAAWVETREVANRCGLALVIAFHAVEAGPEAARLRSVPAASAAIDAVEVSRTASLDLLEQLLVGHGKAAGSLDEKRRELADGVRAEREKLAALEKGLIGGE